MIDHSKEQLLTFAEAARLLPGGHRPAYATWWRWWRHGIKSGVKLTTIMVGGRRKTTVSALRQFFEALSAPSPTEATPSTRRQRERDIRSAEKALADWGI